VAFPALESINPTADSATGGAAASGSTAAGSHAVTLPATVSPGSLLMIFGRVAGAGAVSMPAGWTVVQDSSDASDDVTFYAYMNTLAVGNEDGTSVTVTHGATQKMSAHAVSITGAADPATLPPQASTVAVGTTTTVNPTTATPTGGSKDYLWLWFGAWDGEQTLTKAAATNYTDRADVGTGTGGAVTTNTQQKLGDRAVAGASEDPGAIGTLSVAPSGWTAWTIAIHPAPVAVGVGASNRILRPRRAGPRRSLNRRVHPLMPLMRRGFVPAASGSHVTTTWASSYTVRDRLSTTWASSYVARDRLTTTWQSSYVVRDRLTASWASSYTVSDRLATTWQSSYVVRDRVTTTWGSSYTVHDRAATTWESSYVVRDRATATWESTYTVAPTEAVGVASSFRVLRSDGRRNALLKRLALRPGPQIRSGVVVEEIPTTHETVSWGSSYAVRDHAITTWQSSYSVRDRVTTTWASSYVVTDRVTTTWVSGYGVGGRSATTWTSSYVVRDRTTASWQSTYVVRDRLSATWGSSYAVRDRLAASWASSWTTRRRAASTWQSSFVVRERLQGAWVSSFLVTDHVAVSWTSRYAVQSITYPPGYVEVAVRHAKIDVSVRRPVVEVDVSQPALELEVVV
jgi:outer membrane protein W